MTYTFPEDRPRGFPLGRSSGRFYFGGFINWVNTTKAPLRGLLFISRINRD
jgi:hypothetical protein